MLDRIIRISLANRVAVLAAAILLLIYGMVETLRTEVDIFPDLNAPVVTVMTEAPGMAPEEVERSVTYPVETAVNGASGVRRVRSASAAGFSTVWVEFDWDTDVYKARQIVSEKLSALASDLPPQAGEPTLGPQSSILGEVLIIGLTADSVTSQQDLRTIADLRLRPRLLSVPGVSSVSVIGGDAREYQVLLDPAAMQGRGATLADVREALQSFNSNASGGVIYQYGNEYIVKGDIATTRPSELAATVVSVSPDGTPVLLSDIARITIGAAEPRLGTASLSGTPAVLLTVTKQPGVGTIGLTDAMTDAIEDLRPGLPADVEINTDIFRQADFISTSIGNLKESLFIGAIFVIVVLFFFLMNLRTTLISLVALPLSIIATVLTLRWLGMTINTMSLGGIAIAIGSLVDDAIVDVENVYKRLRQRRQSGESVVKIVYDASREVRLPIFNSSLIIMASFVPLFFLSGMEGRLLKPLGTSFVVALIASTVVALTVTPVLCSYLLASGKDAARLDREPALGRRLGAWYSAALSRLLPRWRPVSIATGILFVGALALAFTLGRSFLPAFNEGSLTVNVSTLPGISLEESDRVGREAEKILLSMPEISLTARKTGRAELDEHSLGVNVSEIEAPYTLDHGRSRAELMADLRHRLGELPGVNIEIGQPISHRIDAMLSGTEAQIAVKIFGPDLGKLHRLGTEVSRVMSGIPGVVDVNVEQQIERPQLDIRPRREMLAYYGIPLNEFADFINVAIGGEKVSQVYEEGYPFDVTLRMAPEHRSTIEDIASLPIDTRFGKVPLSEVAEIVSATGPNTVNRENAQRRIVVSANVAGSDLRGAADEIRARVADEVAFPEGYTVTYGGQFENAARASSTLALVSAIALVVIFLLLYSEYRSLWQAAIILLNMPLALIGGVVLLKITGGELNIPAIIGFISLMGISVRNGMLLMSRYDQLRASGMALDERILTGSADRLNPILMTALSSALALIPLALGGDRPGNEIQSPLAIVILGGLLSSTVLNLFVVPLAYRKLCRKTEKTA